MPPRKKNLGVARAAAGHVVIDLTDTAMQRQTRREVERKVEDRRIVGELKAMLRAGIAPQDILAYCHDRVAASSRTVVLP